MPTTDIGFRDSPTVSGRSSLAFFGPTLYVRIGYDPTYQPGGFPSLPEQDYPALVDTGASSSCIDSDLATHLHLQVIDQQNISGVHGTLPVNIYAAQLYIPSLNQTIYGQFAGVHLNAGGQMHKAIIGRYFLSDFAMNYDGRSGTVILSND